MLMDIAFNSHAAGAPSLLAYEVTHYMRSM